MKISGLYYVADHAPSNAATGPSALQTLISTLQTKYTATPLPRWSLEHRLQRSTPTTPGDAKPSAYHHVLSLSYYPGKTFLHVHPAPPSTTPAQHLPVGPDNVVVAIPVNQAEPFTQLLTKELSALWMQRQSLSVREGLAFGIGELVVRVGELRSTRGVGGNPPALHGLVVCIESRVGDVNTSDTGASDVPSEQEAQETVRDVHEIIRGLWSDLGVQARKEGIKEVLGQYEGPREEQAGWAEVRMWCEVLRLRS